MKTYLYLLSVLLFSFSAKAKTTYIISSAADTGPNTLREAITRINSGTDPAPYTVSFAIAGPVSLTEVLPAITQSCTITGRNMLTPATAAGGTTIERSGTAGNFSVLSFNGNGITVWLQDLILQNGAAGDGDGGALLINISDGTVTLNRCLVRNSSAYAGGGARIVAGTITVNDCQFANNTATNPTNGFVFGGGLAMACTSFTASRCSFLGNTARFGGAVDTYAAQAVFVNCTFSGNTSNQNGRVIYANSDMNSDFIQCSFINNPNINGITGNGVAANETGTMRAINCLVAGNGGARFWPPRGNKPVSLGGNVSTNTNDAAVFDQPSDKTGLAVPYGSLQQYNGGLVSTYSVGDCSPAKDAGVTSSTAVTIPATDANNKSRIGVPDAGAFEVQGPTTASLTAGISGTITCLNRVLTAALGGGINGTYSFSGPGLTTTNSSGTAIISQHGLYSLTVTSAEGCSASATTSVFANTATPAISLTATNNGRLTCTVHAITLTFGSSTAGVNFSTTSPGGPIQATNQLTVNTAGAYSVTAINPQNGCISTTTASVVSSTNSPGVSLTATNGGVITCAVPTLTLTPASPTESVAYSFASANPFINSGNSILINATGLYSVTAINAATGCFSTTSLTISENLIPPGTVTIAPTGAIGCGPNSVTLAAGAAGTVSYTLLPAQQSNTSGQFVVTSTGTYTVIAASGSGTGCQSSGTVTVNQGVGALAGPVSASGQLSGGNAVRLSASGTGSRFVFTGPGGFVFSTVYRLAGSYSAFANGVGSPGVYTLTVYGTEGCPPATSSITVN